VSNPAVRNEYELDALATSICFIGARAHFALGDGTVFVEDSGRLIVHDGAILTAAPHPDGVRLLTGGDDGKLRITDFGQEPATLASFGARWVDHIVASAQSGVIVAGVGKEAVVFKDDRELHRFAYPSSVGALALDAKGRRLAASHYGGATLRYALAPDDAGVALNWAGSHLAVTFSPGADYVVTAMQELELHGWKLPEKQDLRMSGAFRGTAAADGLPRAAPTALSSGRSRARPARWESRLSWLDGVKSS
jgi:WD40 repeat protein